MWENVKKKKLLIKIKLYGVYSRRAEPESTITLFIITWEDHTRLGNNNLACIHDMNWILRVLFLVSVNNPRPLLCTRSSRSPERNQNRNVRFGWLGKTLVNNNKRTSSTKTPDQTQPDWWWLGFCSGWAAAGACGLSVWVGPDIQTWRCCGWRACSSGLTAWGRTRRSRGWARRRCLCAVPGPGPGVCLSDPGRTGLWHTLSGDPLLSSSGL